MRTTKQIDNLAESIRRKNDEILGEDDKALRAIPEKEGPIPLIVHLEDIAAEKRFVTEKVKEYLQQNSKISIGIIASRNLQIKTYASWMTDAGIQHEIINKESTFSMAKPGVKIVNAFNTKGLEFTRVIIPQFIEGNFPYKHLTDDEEEMELFLARCRNLVYVGMTRAQFSLMITYAGENGSRFIGELDPLCYEAKGLTTTYNSGNQRIEKGTDVVLPPTAKVEKTNAEGKGLKDFFKDKGLEVIDKRPAGGSLWIVGDKDKLTPHIKEAGGIYGAYGKFAPNGGRATNYRPSWFTMCKK